MAAVAVIPEAAAGPAAATPRGGRVWRRLVLGLAALYFAVPMAVSFWFTVRTGDGGLSLAAYGRILSAPGFVPSLLLSLGLAAATITLVLLLTLPAMLAARLGAPRLGPLLEVIATLPLVVPPITYVVGIGTALRGGVDALAATPLWATLIAIQDERFPVVLVLAYVMLTLPFAHRSLDAGLRAIDVRTLVEAARNLGASWPHVLFRVIMPNLRPALAGASFLTLALVMGEYTVAALLGYQTFPVWIVTVSGNDGQLSVALSILSLLLIWSLLLTLSGAGRRRS
ncbi:putative spermidine/putrescine transport system permease protein [Streptosporangium becharense]|uniref:Putative spermidine/putrescine transport system permease protein n=1 Tax=Streptosporangium becharense TaxID=1816182 RepID=A0A7W9MIY4_9ACTN|nr:ABC transporter permease subunit [Streptosporangium becharense]MBB2910988.1 putative spermidine/putrescine transport system permease protein [Streptosporangium becharense]MBB5821954.1 putative spermidine/putrescine transport system permease protein [Streptosporangium becharense]